MGILASLYFRAYCEAFLLPKVICGSTENDMKYLNFIVYQSESLQNDKVISVKLRFFSRVGRKKLLTSSCSSQ